MMRPEVSDRWAILGLGDPDPQTDLAEDPTTADLLIYALSSPGAVDPVEGILAAIAVELTALADPERKDGGGEVLLLLARRIEVALRLLRRGDERERTPPEDPPEDSPPSGCPEPTSQVAQDDAPGGAPERA